MNHFITPLDLEIFCYALKAGVTLFGLSIAIIMITYAWMIGR